MIMSDNDDLKKKMVQAQEEQKKLLIQRDFLIKGENYDKNSALEITHRIAKLLDFIKYAENKLKATD